MHKKQRKIGAKKGATGTNASIQFSAPGFSAEKYPNNGDEDYLRRLLEGKIIHGGVETPSVCVTFTGYK